MAERKTLKCHECGETFRREELVEHCSPNSKTSYRYCPKCLNEKIAREHFSETVCRIFNLKAPGPRIWKERERLQETYGYTDQIICDCLEYLYEINHTKKLAESLCLVTPTNVEAMMKLKRQQQSRANLFENLIDKEYKYKTIKIRENEDEPVILNDINSWF